MNPSHMFTEFTWKETKTLTGAFSSRNMFIDRTFVYTEKEL